MAGTKTYAGAVSSAVLQGVTAGAWVAAAGLSPAKRRVVRAGLMVAGVGVGLVQGRRAQPDEMRLPAQPDEPRLLDSPVLVRDVLAREVPEPAEPERKLPPRSVLVALALSTGLAIGGRRLEKRWLARLVRAGHTRPHRSLGIRMGLLTAGTALASDLIAVAEARRGERDHAG